MNIVVYPKKISGSINGISSKSYAQRAIFISALSKGVSFLKIDTISDDIKRALDTIKSLGCEIDLDENIYKIKPPNIYKSNTYNVGESGTTLRFLIPIISVLGLNGKIIREGSLINRPNDIYFDLIPSHGAFIKEDNEYIIQSGSIKEGIYELDGDISSQFISGLLIALSYLEKESKIIVNKELQSRDYVNMTIAILEKFGVEIIKDKNIYTIKNTPKGTKYIVEKDWSNALFFLAAGVEVIGLNKNSKQGDKEALLFLEDLGFFNISKDEFKLEKINKEKDIRILDAKNIPDTVPILCILSAITKGYTKVINTKRLKIKESNRVKSTIEMLRNLGVDVVEYSDSFSFNSVDEFKECKINSYNDHRIAMSATIASNFSKGKIEILGAESVNKSYVNFYEDFKNLGGEIDVI